MGYLEDKEGKIIVSNYDRCHGHYGELVDWVTEYEWTSPESISEDDYMKLLKENNYIPTGFLEFSKRKCLYNNGEVLYKHIVREVNF